MDVYYQVMHLSLETPPPPGGDVGHTWGFVSAYMTYQPPGGGGIVHFRQFIL